MRVSSIEKVLPCISDPWKLRVIAHLDEVPDLSLLTRYLGGRYSEGLGVLMVKYGNKELNIFNNGKVAIRRVKDVEEGEMLINRILSMAYHKAMISEEL
ncbi:hypothetical protein [Methanohalophilus sp.]|uniref:hypothetical protein n=1 Tax=Methanohalophilus sp. TaxID=1966352 RepID=UPI002618C8FC|nr:hypothetical protein [Methanohalophilus sp.]MDK2891819.1 hypothetical protein [Methanohalophilus sp.]